jgi:PAS domain S-box-containing protein
MRSADHDSSSTTPGYMAASAVAASETANQDLRALQALTDTALSHLSLDDLLPALLERVQEALSVDNAAVLLLDPAGQTLTMRVVRGPEEAVAGQVHVPVGQGFAGRIAETREPLVVDDLSAFPVVNLFLREQLCSAAGVPLLAGDQSLGVVHVGTTQPRHFTTHDVRLLQQVADRIALAIDRARLYTAEQQAREMAELAQARSEAALARAQVSEHRYQRLVEANIVGVVVTDSERVLEANDAFLRLLGYTQVDVQAGRLHRDTLSTPDTLVLAERSAQEAVATGASAPFEREYVRKDGSRVPVLVAPVLLQHDPVRLVNFVLDLTEHKSLEYQREAAHVSELAAQNVAKQLDAFLATAAHDIRSPVTVISGQVQVALRRAERLAEALDATSQTASKRNQPLTQAAEGVVDSLRSAQAGVDRLRRLVDHLFDVAQVQTGRLTLELAPYDLAALVRRNVASQQAAAPERRIDLAVPAGEAPVEADADRLDQVLSNYLTNALKYSAHDQPVAVRLIVVKNMAVVSVEDHGPGLPPEEQSRVWEAFYRAPGVEIQPGSREVGGSLGLGLHICKQLIELHPGGSVGVESVVGEGSTFWFRLPLARAAPSKRR